MQEFLLAEKSYFDTILSSLHMKSEDIIILMLATMFALLINAKQAKRRWSTVETSLDVFLNIFGNLRKIMSGNGQKHL